MSNINVGDDVKVVSDYPEMRETLREYMISGRKARVIRQSNPGQPNRYLVKFDVADASHGIYWLQSSVLAHA